MRTSVNLLLACASVCIPGASLAQELSLRAQVSIECSRQAEVRGLRGEARKNFRAKCMRGAPARVEVPPNLGPTVTICVRPTFEQEMKLRSLIDGSPEQTQEVAQAILYLRDQFCRTTHENLVAQSETHVGDNCFQYTGLYRGERVYWGMCLE